MGMSGVQKGRDRWRNWT